LSPPTSNSDSNAPTLSSHSPFILHQQFNKPELQTIFLQSRLLGAARLSSNCRVSLISRWAHRRCCLPRRCAAPGECGRVKLFYLESRRKWTAGSCETLVFSYYQINQSCCLTRGNQLNDDGLVSLWKYQRTTIHPVGQEGTSGRKNDSTCTIRHQPKSFLWWTAIWLHSVLPAQGGLWHIAESQHSLHRKNKRIAWVFVTIFVSNLMQDSTRL